MGTNIRESGPPDGQQVLSISDLTARIRDCLQAQFSSVWVAGEISDLARPQSGHIYFTLKDPEAQLRAVMWRGAASRLKLPLEDGVQVLCHGEIDIYPPRGSYQLIVRRMELQGEGALQRALRQLHARLAREGLFDAQHKQPLPKFPNRVALVTSPTGAALRDFLEVARRRWHGSEIVIFPVRVQGDAAAGELVSAIQTANALAIDFDVLVVTRGGGSMEDLWSFNDEQVVRAIHDSNIPVVSAVGHEIDVTLSDLVADVRALTPSEAAERVLPSADEVREALRHWRNRMVNVLTARFQRGRTRLDALAARRVLRRPEERIQQLARQLDEIDLRVRRAVVNQQQRARQRLRHLADQLDSLSPLAVLARGYSITQRVDTGLVIRDASDVQSGDEIKSCLASGEVVSRVDRIERKEIGQ